MPAAIKHIITDLGASRPWVLTYLQPDALTPVDISACSATMTWTDALGAATVLTSVDGITLGGVAGTISVDKSHASYAALPAGQYSYKLLLTYADSTTAALLCGKWTIRGAC